MNITFTRLEAATQFGISNTMIKRHLQALQDMGFSDLLLLDSNRLTTRAIELIALLRNKNQAALDEALALENGAADTRPAAAIVEIPNTGGSYSGLVPHTGGQYSIAPVASFSAAQFENQADSALTQWQDMQDQMGAAAQQMQANNEQMGQATTAAARTMAAQMLMGVSAELSQQLAAGMPLVQQQALAMMMGKQAPAAADPAS